MMSVRRPVARHVTVFVQLQLIDGHDDGRVAL